MNKLLQIIRLLTLVCYFLPFTFLFVTCSGKKNEILDFAYNKKEAAENEIKDKDSGWFGTPGSTATDTASSEMPSVDSSDKIKEIADTVDTNKVVALDKPPTTTIMGKLKDLLGVIEWIMIKPSETSETALGVIFISYKTHFGVIVIGVSLFLSLIIFVIGCFKKHNKRLVLMFTVINLFCIAAFVVDALVNNVQLLYGVWLCSVLITLSVALQYRRMKGQTPVKLHRG